MFTSIMPLLRLGPAGAVPLKDPVWAMSDSARCTVALLTPYRSANSSSVGTEAPAGNSSERIAPSRSAQM